VRAVYICTSPDPDSWRYLQCDTCGRVIEERVAMCWSCLLDLCVGRLRPINKWVPKAERW
jgi:hypothetical protein